MGNIKKLIICMIALLFLLCGCEKKEEQVYAIMVDHVLYYSTGEVVSGVGIRDVIGRVESYTEGIPTENGQANFNPELGNPYAMVDGSFLAVKIEDEWIRFRVEKVFWNGEVETFSFREDLGYYAGLTMEEFEAGKAPEDYWIQTSGFVNTEPSPIQDGEDAMMRAANECKFQYIGADVSYDEETDMWCVLFWEVYAPGGGITVYLDSDGITRLVVPGE